MSDKKVLDLILDKLINLEKGQANLEKGQKTLQESFNRLERNFDKFQEETEQNFKYTNDMINQAFEKISENMEQKEKVDTIFNILKTSRPTKLNSYKRNFKKEELIA